jgi:hypothetical protein
VRCLSLSTVQTWESRVLHKVVDLSFDSRLGSRSVLEDCRSEAEKLLRMWMWKSGLEKQFPLIISLMGGTGTGKSTLFNSLAGIRISEVGHRRPCTRDPVILVHEEAAESFGECPVVTRRIEGETRGNASENCIVTHRQAELAHVVLVDTPDIDSVELSNRVTAQNFFVISDAIIFVTSQEKYGDLAGHEMTLKAAQWGKKTFFIMNKVASDAAYNDFREEVKRLGFTAEPIRIDRLDSPPDLIPGVRDRTEFSVLIAGDENEMQIDEIREQELSLLRQAAAESLAELGAHLDAEFRRISSVNAAIDRALSETALEMQRKVDAVVTNDVETRIRDRLRDLTAKYDILFVPRQKLREFVRFGFGTVFHWLGFASDKWLSADNANDNRAADLAAVRSVANLQPLEAALAHLDLRIAELISSDRALDDLRSVARAAVPVWSTTVIQRLYNETFPGVEQLLEEEFKQFQDGLPVGDRLKLYGWSTVWAACLVTAEIVVGGGFSLLDAVLNTAILPCIPTLVLKARVAGLLREIGERVDREHRRTLTTVLNERGQAYKKAFGELLPRDVELEALKTVSQEMGRNVPAVAVS